MSVVKHADGAIVFCNRVLTGSFDENHFVIATRAKPNRWRSYRELESEDNKYRGILKNFAMTVERDTVRERMRTRQKRVSLWILTADPCRHREEDHRRTDSKSRTW